ncbi:hypothetical protein DPMN_156789 [Dreissena polymorpha]|uniref:Uncharacterized protein n=1 Tax=Dreissena polymorpha TaxID=45954 RepID=A0A9D4JB48_DREPO|nr:hypothetical protein DPMN_156789 [Dreissena polymorpha]
MGTLQRPGLTHRFFTPNLALYQPQPITQQLQPVTFLTTHYYTSRRGSKGNHEVHHPDISPTICQKIIFSAYHFTVGSKNVPLFTIPLFNFQEEVRKGNRLVIH